MIRTGRIGRGVATLGVALLLSTATASPWSTWGLAQATTASTTSAPAASPTANREPAAHVEARIADLHKRLHITADQEPQFKAFADVMRANAQSMEALFHERAQHRDRTAMGQLHWYAQLTTAHAEALNRLLPVFDALYGSLSDTQKKAADAAFVPLRQSRPPHRHG